jgi:hypothetical protein
VRQVTRFLAAALLLTLVPGLAGAQLGIVRRGSSGGLTSPVDPTDGGTGTSNTPTAGRVLVGNGTDFVTASGVHEYCADAGANDTYACNLSPAPTALITGALYAFKANTANTGAASINFNSLGAKTIVKVQGAITTALDNNDIRVGQVVVLRYDGTNMQMVSQLGNAPAGSGTVSAGSANDIAVYSAATTVAPVAGFTFDGTTLSIPGSGGAQIGLPGATSGTTTLKPAAIAGTTTFTLPGATSDLSATGGANHVLKQTSAGGALTSGAVAFSELSGTATTSQVPAVSLRHVCAMVVGTDNGSVLADADLGPQNHMCFFPRASTVQEIVVIADGGTPNVIVRKTAVDGTTHTALLSSALATAASGAVACAKTSAVAGINATTTCSATLQNNTIAVGQYLGLASGTAGGVAKRMSVFAYYTID